ncbi:hypothetical protein RI367_002210 [Sorochytrium milnesiophthora]
MPQGPPAKRTNLSKKPLRGLNWTKIAPNKIGDTVWKSIDDEPIHQTMDYTEFEDLFAATQALGKKEKVAESVENVSGSVNNLAKAQVITVIDAKRAQNLTILLKKIKLPVADIIQAIFQADTTIMTNEVINELLKFIPEPDEISSLSQYENELNNLAQADRFLYEVSKIAKYEQRLKAINFLCTHKELLEDVERMAECWIEASQEVKSSKGLRTLLQIILALGNYMNQGQRGGAYGFKLEGILKLGDVKSSVSGRKHTLLHYLCELVDKKFPECASLGSQLSHIEEASKISVSALRAGIATAKKETSGIKTLVEVLEKDPKAKGTKFVSTMGTFAQQTAATVEKLEEKFKKGEQDFDVVVSMFGEDPKVLPVEEFYGMFHRFCVSFQQAKLENDLWVQKQAENDKKEAEKKRREQEKENAAKKKLEKQGATNDRAIIDDLVAGLKSGKTFGGNVPAPSGKFSKRAEGHKGESSPLLAKRLLNVKAPGAEGGGGEGLHPITDKENAHKGSPSNKLLERVNSTRFKKEPSSEHLSANAGGGGIVRSPSMLEKMKQTSKATYAASRK